MADLADLKNVYLIHGSEELLLDRAVRRLKERLAKVADLDFNMEAFDGENATVDDVVNAANTMPFMSERRLVIVRDVDKLTNDEQGRLADYAKDPAPYTTLVLVAKKVNRGSRLYKAADALGGVAEYAPPKRGEYPAEVTRMFAEHGKRAATDAAYALVDAVGRDLRRLDSEIDKVVAYVGTRERVTAQDIAEVVSAGEASIFEFLDALGGRDAASAIAILRRLTAAGESVHGVLAMSARHVRALLGARALMDRGTRADEMAPVLGMAPWQVRNVLGQAGGFTPAELSRALRGLAAVEAEMKSGALDPVMVLERWVIATCGARGAGRAKSRV
jgi:DNA polymerase-3 subunit delta